MVMETAIGTMLPTTTSFPSPLKANPNASLCPSKFSHTHLKFKPRLHPYPNSLPFQRSCSIHIPSRLIKQEATGGLARAYLEKPDKMKEIASKIIGSLPVVGLLYRLLSEEGGVAGERIRLSEFSKRVENRCSPDDAMAFYEFRERHGKRGNPRFVLVWCWVAAVGAGLVKSDEILLGASRLRVSFDIQYEEDNFIVLMDQASAKREKSKSSVPDIPVEAKAGKALEAICKCCIDNDMIEEEDARLLCIMLSAVFPTADKAEIERIVWSRVEQSPADEEISDETNKQQTDESTVLQQDTETVYR